MHKLALGAASFSATPPARRRSLRSMSGLGRLLAADAEHDQNVAALPPKPYYSSVPRENMAG
jgi:hypothetical protein